MNKAVTVEKVSIIIPVFNASKTILLLVDKIQKEIMRLLDESATIYFVARRSQIRALTIVTSSGQLFDKIVDTKIPDLLILKLDKDAVILE